MNTTHSSRTTGRRRGDSFWPYKWAGTLGKLPNLKTRAKLVGWVLADFANSKTGECWPGRSNVAEMTGMSERTVTTALGELQAAGALVEVEHARQHFAPHYKLVMPVTVEHACAAGEETGKEETRVSVEPGESECAARVESSRSQGGKDLPPNDDATAIETATLPHKKSLSRTRRVSEKMRGEAPSAAANPTSARGANGHSASAREEESDEVPTLPACESAEPDAAAPSPSCPDTDAYLAESRRELYEHLGRMSP